MDISAIIYNLHLIVNNKTTMIMANAVKNIKPVKPATPVTPVKNKSNTPPSTPSTYKKGGSVKKGGKMC